MSKSISCYQCHRYRLRKDIPNDQFDIKDFDNFRCYAVDKEYGESIPAEERKLGNCAMAMTRPYRVKDKDI